MTAPRLLVADIGGTNTRAALSDGVQLRASTITRFRNVEFGSLAEVLAAFVAQHGTPPLDGACIALAGPVTQQGAEAVGQMTNLQWQLDTAQMRAVTGAPQAAIINDLQAQAYALPHLDKSHIEQLFGPAGTPGAPQLVWVSGPVSTPRLRIPPGVIYALCQPLRRVTSACLWARQRSGSLLNS